MSYTSEGVGTLSPTLTLTYCTVGISFYRLDQVPMLGGLQVPQGPHLNSWADCKETKVTSSW